MKLARKIEVRSNSNKLEADTYVHYLVPGIKSFSKYMGFAVSLIGLLVIAGWLLGVEQLNNALAGLSAMEANTALAFITAGLSLWLRGSTNPKMQTAVQILGAITGLIGLLTLGEYLSGRNFGIDELIFKDLASSGVLHPGRMSFMSALNFTMLGMALLLIDSDNERRYNLAQSLALVSGVIAYVVLAGHLFNVDSLYRVGVFAPMAFHTALSFILLFVGIICAQPDDGWVGNLIADNLGGDLLRRLLPVAFIVPILLAWLRMQGQLAGYYQTALGTTLLAVATTLFLSIIIWFNAKGLTRVDMDRRQAEEELRQSEERFRSIVNQTLAGIVETDLIGTFLTVNERYLEITGYAREELVSRMQMRDITHPDDLPRTFELLQECLEQGTPFEIEKRYIRKDGSFVWINNSVSAIKGVDGKPHSFVAVVIDITKRKLAEELEQSATANLRTVAEANAKFRTFFDQGSYFAGVMSLDGTIIEANRLSLEAGGYARDEVIGRKFWDCGWWNPSPALMEMVRNGTREAADGKLFRQESKYFLADGSERFVDLIIAPVKDDQGRLLFLAPTGTDITERKQAEEALQFARDEAEQTADRIARLQKVTAALSEALTPSQVAKIIVDQGAPALGAVSGTMMLLAEDGQNLEIVYSVSSQLVIQPYQRFSISLNVPAADAARSGQPIWIESRQQYLERYPHLADQINLWGHQSAIAIPMFDKGRMLGVLTLSFDNVLSDTPKDQDYVLTLARQGAQALERARLYEAEQQARQVTTEFAQQQEALYKLTDQLQRTNSLEDVFNASLDAILGALQCDRASILLFNDSDVMHFVAWRGLSDNYRKITDGHSPWKPDEKNAEPICISDIATGEISDSLRDVIQSEGIGSLAFIPLVSDETLIGKFMIYYNAPHVFSYSELELSLTIAHQLAFGIERKRAEKALRKSKERYHSLFELVPVAVYACDAEGLIQEFNHRAVELWGREPLKNDPRERFCGSFKMYYADGRFMPNETCPMARVLSGETLEPQELEILVERPDGTRHNIIAHPLPLKDESGKITGAINCFYDITARKRAEEALRESEQRFHAILRQATAGIVRKDAEGKLMFVNQAFCNMLGYTESELLGKMIWQLTHNDDVEENKRLYDRTMIEGIPFKLEKRLIRRDGSILWVDVSVSPIMDATGKPESAVAVEVDITGRKQAEEALRDLNIQLESRVQNRTVKLQEANQSLLNEIAERQKAEEALHESGKRLQILSQRLVEVQEEERRAIARELHDSVGQSLSALNINLVILDNQISNSADEQIRTRLNDSMQLTAETISLVRDVMSDLRPSVLDDYGLEAALQSYMDQFKSRYGIKILFERPDQPLRRLGSSIEMTFLRIAQEALLNIARHAHADQVNMSLGQDGNAVRLIVQDDGSGIESWQEANRPGSHGLTIMRERADAVGGNLRVLSIPGKGTKVEVSIPIENGHLQTVLEERRE